MDYFSRRRVYDRQSGKDVVLTDEQVCLLFIYFFLFGKIFFVPLLLWIGSLLYAVNFQVEKIHNITSGKFPTIGYNPYEPMIEFYSSIPNIHPLDGRWAFISNFRALGGQRSLELSKCLINHH